VYTNKNVRKIMIFDDPSISPLNVHKSVIMRVLRSAIAFSTGIRCRFSLTASPHLSLIRPPFSSPSLRPVGHTYNYNLGQQSLAYTTSLRSMAGPSDGEHATTVSLCEKKITAALEPTSLVVTGAVSVQYCPCSVFYCEG